MKKMKHYLILLTALLVSGSAWADVVAKVGDVSYDNLANAIKASSETTPAVLQRSVNLSSSITINSTYATIPCLDLNGDTITSTADDVFVITDKGLTLIDNSAGHTGVINNSVYDIIYASNTKSATDTIFITVKGCTLNESANNKWAYGITMGSTKAADMPYPIVLNAEDATINTPNGTSIPAFSNVIVNLKNVNLIGGPTKACIQNNGSDELPTIVNIDGGELQSGDHALYMAGKCICNISGNTTISGGAGAIEIRAGELNIKNGTFNCSGDVISCTPNSNGTTTKGAAIEIAQHTTKQPIAVTIDGGIFTAPLAMIQVNPQNNTEVDYCKMIVNVNGGSFKSTYSGEPAQLYSHSDFGTVNYTKEDMLISQNRRIFLRGGYYNNDPIDFVAPGYQRIVLADIPQAQKTPEDIAAIAANYRYKIGVINPETATTTQANGDWKKDAATIWAGGVVPTDATPVIIDKEIVISTPAHAYSVTLAEAGLGETTKLTIKRGGMLMVGSGGFSGSTNLNFFVEDGGMLCLAPNASEFINPEGTVIVSSDFARRKNSAEAKEVGQLTGDDLYWRHIACPTINNDRDLTISKPGYTYINTWSLKNGWESKGADAVKAPFVGYNISTTLLSSTRGSDTILYTFEGDLAGNKVDPLKFANSGFTFFGNSYLAPIDIRELLTSLDVNSDVESTVILYKYQNDTYEYINRARYAIPSTTAEIAPLQGFFVFSAEPASIQYNYTKAIWDAFCAKARSIELGTPSAPVRKQSINNNFDAIACISLSASNGMQDNVYLFEGADFSSAFENGYDARKMNTTGLNIAALDADKKLAIIATDNLEGTALSLTTNDATQYTLSFSNVSGKELAIYDALTEETTNIVEGAIYNFTADANATLNNRFSVVGAHQMPTDLSEQKANVSAKGIYTILGEYLGEGNLWMTLPSGVYIVNGEKMVR